MDRWTADGRTAKWRLGKNKRDSNGAPFKLSDRPSVRPSTRHGGAGNRTLVRVSFQNYVYVCRLDFMPSLQSGIEPTSPKPIS